MGKGPGRFNVVTLLMLVGLAAIGYGLWKFFPVYWTAWGVDHVLADGGAKAYQISRLPQAARTQRREELIADLRQKVVELGIVDPQMTVSLDFVGTERVDVGCEYRAIVVHPYVNRYTVVTMHR